MLLILGQAGGEMGVVMLDPYERQVQFFSLLFRPAGGEIVRM